MTLEELKIVFNMCMTSRHDFGLSISTVKPPLLSGGYKVEEKF